MKASRDMMTPLDYSCSYFDVPGNFACNALPGQLCNWPDGKRGRREDAQFHAERIEAAAAMNAGPGKLMDTSDVDRAIDEALSGRETDRDILTTEDASIG